MNPTIRHLLISKDHNYYGHHGKKPGETPMVAMENVECVAGKGIRGDRFFDYKPNYKGQITFFSWEILQQLWKDLSVPSEKQDVTATRRNVIVSGVDLNSLIGKEFSLQGIHFLGTEECKPCYWMNQAIDSEAEEWMRGRGGLRAKILTSGILQRNFD